MLEKLDRKVGRQLVFFDSADSISLAKLSKANKGRLASIKTGGGESATSGLASSLSFTPAQGWFSLFIFLFGSLLTGFSGIELIDPSAARARAAVAAANSSWFAEGTFTHVSKK